MYLYELQRSSIDQELKDTAQSVEQAGGLGQEEDQEAPEPDQMELEEPEREHETQPMDSNIIAAVQGHDYVRNYRHDPKSQVAPEKIAHMELDDLYQVRNVARNRIVQSSMYDRFGLYDDPETKFFQDLISYTEKVIDVKKKASGDEPKQSGSKQDNSKPKVQQQEPSKNAKAGPVKKRKSNQ